MKKFTFTSLILAVALMALMVQSVSAQPSYVSDQITVAAGATSASKTFLIGDASGPIQVRDLDSFTVVNTSGTGTGTVTLLTVDFGVETSIFNAGAHVPAYSTVSYPRRTATEASQEFWATTNRPVAYVTAGFSVTTGNVAVVQSTVTNYYMQASAIKLDGVLSKYVPHTARSLKVNIAQPASATDNVYSFTIIAK
jgi:hypothetical protein